MSDFEYILACFLVPIFGVMCYLAGKGDLLTLIPEIFKQHLEKITKQGEWIDGRCSLCGYQAEVKQIGFDCCQKSKIWYKDHNYCPNCGGIMKELE